MAKRISQLSPQQAALFLKRKREYGDPSGRGKRLNISGIVGEFRIPRTSFYRHYARRLESVPMAYRDGKKEATYLESEVTQALQDPAPPSGEFLVDREPHFTFERAMRELGLSRQVLNKLSGDFPFGDENTLLFRWVKSPETAMDVQVCSVKNVRLAQTKFQEVEDGRLRMPDGRVFISPKRALQNLAIGRRRPTLKGLDYMLRHGCVCVAGRSIAQLRIPALFRKGRAQRWPLEEHVLEIKSTMLRARRGAKGSTLAEICKAAGVRRISDRFRVRAFLTELQSRTELVPNNNSRGFIERVTFDREEVKRLLDGRTLLDAAREYLEKHKPAAREIRSARAAESVAELESSGGQDSSDRGKTIPLVLGPPGGTPLLFGSPMPTLTKGTYAVVKVLIEAGGIALSESKLDARSNRSNARKFLKRLCKKHPGWARVIVSPGKAFSGYSLVQGCRF